MYIPAHFAAGDEAIGRLLYLLHLAILLWWLLDKSMKQRATTALFSSADGKRLADYSKLNREWIEHIV